jgi:hypothetical protein
MPEENDSRHDTTSQGYSSSNPLSDWDNPFGKIACRMENIVNDRTADDIFSGSKESLRQELHDVSKLKFAKEFLPAYQNSLRQMKELYQPVIAAVEKEQEYYRAAFKGIYDFDHLFVEKILPVTALADFDGKYKAFFPLITETN